MTTHHHIQNLHDAYAQVHWDHLAQKPQYCPEIKQLTLSYPCQFQEKALLQTLNHKPTPVYHKINSKIEKHQPQGLLQPLKKIKNIIAIHANKGGVGKSTIAINIATALAQTGCRVGLLDGDLYGPNQPDLTGHHQKTIIDDTGYTPVEKHGIHLMSMGFLIDKSTPLVWRGPMASAYFQQMVFKTHWPDLDYLIIDCPPGTGDVLLTMTQKIPISGVVLATTPQCMSLKDCQKGIAMLRKMDVPILGYIENMAVFTCDQCKKQHHLFAKNPVKMQMDTEGITHLGTLPLDPLLVQSCETGIPLLRSHPSTQSAALIQQIATRMSAKLACRPLAKPPIFTSAKKK